MRARGCLQIVRQEVPAALIGKDGSVTAAVASSVKVRQTEGKLTVVDLAGSERIKKSAAQDKRLKEAININTSLLMLGNVIQSLASRQSHVPFRDSALTRLLESSIGGNSRCAMIVCVAPEPVHISESLSTLEFASRAMRVETRPILHESTVDMDPKELAKSLSSQFESDVAMRSQVELAQLRHSLQAEARKAEESSRAARSAGAQVQELRRLLQEEAAGRQAAEAESREAMRKLSAKESALKKTMVRPLRMRTSVAWLVAASPVRYWPPKAYRLAHQYRLGSTDWCPYLIIKGTSSGLSVCLSRGARTCDLLRENKELAVRHT